MCHELAHRRVFPKSKLCASRLRRDKCYEHLSFPPRRDPQILSLSPPPLFSKTPPQPDFSISMNRRPILWKERILPTLGAIYPVLASISQDLNRLNAFPPLLPNSNSFSNTSRIRRNDRFIIERSIG